MKDLLKQAARGKYQRMLIEGRARWSGADLTGKALDYACKYETSRNNLVKRINELLPENYQATILGDHLVIEGGEERVVI